MNATTSEADRAETERIFRDRLARITEASGGALTLEDGLAILADAQADTSVRRAVLMRPDLPIEAVELALSDPEDTVRAFAVGLLIAPPDMVRKAEVDSAWQVRAELARRSDCPVDILERLSLDPDAVVRRSAIAHAGVGNAVLLRVLVSGKSRLDAELAAGHPSLDVAAHEEVLCKANAFGAMALLRRCDLTETLLANFVVSRHPVNVRVAAVKHDSCPAHVVGVAVRDDHSREVRQSAAARRRCPESDLVSAAGDAEAEVRRAVAGNESAPAAAITVLLSDVDELVRRDASKSDHADPAMLAALVTGDPDTKVRKAALANHRCLPSVVDAACADPVLVFTAGANPARTREGSFAALMTMRVMPRQQGRGDADAEQRQRDRVRKIAKKCVDDLKKQDWAWLVSHSLEMLNPLDLEPIISKHLFQAASDGREVVRMAVARHPKSDVTVLMTLSTDPSEAVRRAVSERILNAVDGSI